MIRRFVSVAMLVIATLLVGLAAGLLWAPDSMEMLAGFIAGSLVRLQTWLALGGVVILAGSVAVDRTPARWHRAWRLSLAGLATLTLIGIVGRDRTAFSQSRVQFTGNDVAFTGTLYRPRGTTGGTSPAVLFLHGSGPVAREAYHMFARQFAERGFIVLNVDKPGVGGSHGTYYGDDLSKDVIQRRAADSRVALDYLGHVAGIDTARLGLFAISQGGWVVPLLAGGDTPARYAIIFSGSAVSSYEEGEWSEWTDENNDHFGMKPPPVPLEELDVRIRGVRPAHFDPRTPLTRMRVPTLWLYGEWDPSQPTFASIRVLDSVAAQGIAITSRVFPHANHGLMIARGPGGRRFPDFAPGVWDSVDAWTTRQGVRRPRAAE